MCTAHLTIESRTNADLSRLEKSDFTHQANITANDYQRDYRRISQPLITWLWFKICDYASGWAADSQYLIIRTVRERKYN